MPCPIPEKYTPDTIQTAFSPQTLNHLTSLLLLYAPNEETNKKKNQIGIAEIFLKKIG
jgi:hypothetical protein